MPIPEDILSSLSELHTIAVKFDPSGDKDQKRVAARRCFENLQAVRLEIDDGQVPGQKYADAVDLLYEKAVEKIDNPNKHIEGITEAYKYALDRLHDEFNPRSGSENE